MGGGASKKKAASSSADSSPPQDQVAPTAPPAAAKEVTSDPPATTGDKATTAKAMALNILLHEDVTMRGGAQIWLANCGDRLKQAGHTVTFLLPEGSLIIPDCEGYGAKVVEFSHERSASDPESYRETFTELLKPAHICVTLVRQKRDNYQNVRFMASCISQAGLKTFLIAKTGTPDPSYEPEFYGGDLLKVSPPQCCTVTIADYTRKFIMDNFGIPSANIQTIYNGTDVNRFKRTPELTEESKKRYPIPEGRFVIGSIGRFVPVKGQKVLLKAAKLLLDAGKDVHLLMVGEGELKDEIEQKMKEMEITDRVSIYEFTKEPFYVIERCDVVAMPSFLEGLPNVLLESLAMETPCVASRIMGCPEVVVDGETGYCFEAGDLKDESTWDKMAQGCADAIAKIYDLDEAGRKKFGDNGKKLVFELHDKDKCFQKILDVIQGHAAAVANA